MEREREDFQVPLCATYHVDQPSAPYRCSASSPSRLHSVPYLDLTRHRARDCLPQIAEGYTSCAEVGRVVVGGGSVVEQVHWD